MKLKKFIFIFLAGILSLTGVGKAKVILPLEVSEKRARTEIVWEKLRHLPVGKRPRITLVLGGGGARGLSHIGVLRVLEEERIPIDRIVGVSVGALIGALYAGGKSVDEIEQMASQIGWDELTDFSKIGMVKLFLKEELLSTSRMESYLEKQIGNKFFNDLNIPFTCIATDLRTGDRVVFREGPVAIAARASATIPGIFRPVEYRQRFLVDGGIVDNLPTQLAEQGPDDFVLAVQPNYDGRNKDVSRVIDTLVRSIEIQRDVIVKEKKKNADFLIEVNVGDISIMDVSRHRELIEAGTRQTRSQALSLKEKIISDIFVRHKGQVGQR